MPDENIPTELNDTSDGPHLLPAGIYQIINTADSNKAFDLSGYDQKSILAYGKHEGVNQLWQVNPLGRGYSIRSVLNKAFITLELGIDSGRTLICAPYPVSWAVEPDDFEAGIYKIGWPTSPLIIDMPSHGTQKVQLNHRYPFKDTALWKFVPVDTAAPDQLEITTYSPRTNPTKPALSANSETIIDVDGLKLGGNGEMSITTTTTTVTTSVTVVKRLGISV